MKLDLDKVTLTGDVSLSALDPKVSLGAKAEFNRPTLDARDVAIKAAVSARDKDMVASMRENAVLEKRVDRNKAMDLSEMSPADFMVALSEAICKSDERAREQKPREYKPRERKVVRL